MNNLLQDIDYEDLPPDLTPSSGWCDAESDDTGDGWVCTLSAGHKGTVHVAGDGDRVVAIWHES